MSLLIVTVLWFLPQPCHEHFLLSAQNDFGLIGVRKQEAGSRLSPAVLVHGLKCPNILHKASIYITISKVCPRDYSSSVPQDRALKMRL